MESLYINYIMSKIWASSTWAFFHSIAENIHPAFYSRNYPYMLAMIKGICANLPCQYCQRHADNYMSRIRSVDVRTKSQFRLLLYNFHNSVNARLGKPQYPLKGLGKYRTRAVGHILRAFLAGFTKSYGGLTPGLVDQAGRRRQFATALVTWIRPRWKQMF
jgi:hypothetical protein